MSYLYGDILRAARDTSAWFDPTRISGGPAIRLASDIQRDLVAKMCKRDPEKLSTTTTLASAAVVAALAVNGAAPSPVALPAAMQVVRMVARYAPSPDGPHTLWAITPDEAIEHTHEMAWYLQGTNAYFTGQPSDWTGVSSVDVTYVPFVSDLVTESDTLVLPDDAKWAFTSRLAYAFALRVNGQPVATEAPDTTQLIQVDINAFKGEATAAEQLWLAQASDQRRRMSRGTIRGDR